MEVMNKVAEQKKIPPLVKIGYGVTGFAAINTFTIFIMYGMFFFTDCVGLDATFAGLVLSIGTLWDAITDPIVGMLSDRRDPKKGRRRPFLKYVAIPFGIIGWLLFTNFNLSPSMTKVYFILMAVAFYTVQTLLDVPYTSLGAEMTQDYDERTTLNSRRNFFATISGIVSSLTLSLVFIFSDMFGSLNAGWSATAALFGIIAMISIYIGYFSTKGYEMVDIAVHTKENRGNIAKDILRNKPFMYTMGLFAASVMSLAVQNSGFVYYLSYNLGLDEFQMSAAFLMSWIPGILYVAIIEKISHKWSKKVAWITCMIVWGISLTVFPLIIFDKIMSMPLIFLMQALAGFGLVGQYQIAWSMIPDTIEVDEFKTGLRREGSYYGLISFLQKAATAVAIMISGRILDMIGYTANGVQTAETLEGIKYLISFGGTGFLIVSILLALLNPMSKERHEALKEAIELKKLGKAYTTEKFDALL